MIIRQSSARKYVLWSVTVIVAALAVYASLLFIKPAAAADPVVTGGSAIIGRTDVYIPVEGVEIQGDIDGTTTVSARVPSGTLRMTTTTGLTFQGSETGRTITFDGTKEDLNAALATLQYRANEAGETSLTVTLGAPGIVFYPGNGHIYEVVTAEDGITWEDARIAAEQRTMNGAQGYLATISEQAENDYITARLVGDGWFGASDTAVEGEWRWVTGPEAGTQFWQGLGNGNSVDGAFSNWSDGEPNNSGDDEGCAQFYGNGSGWNDLPCNGEFTLESYVVEYGAPGNMPVVPSEVTLQTTTTTPAPEPVQLSSCQQFFDEFVNSNEHRYDDITLSQDLDCGGVTVKPLFSDTELVYDEDEEEDVVRPIAFRGSFNGNGHTISNLIIENPVTDDEEYPTSGFFASVDPDTTIENLTLSNVTVRGAECVGGIVGSAKALTLRNVHFNGSIEYIGDYGSHMGGLVGCINMSSGSTLIENSSFGGAVKGDDIVNNVGGIVGLLEVGAYENSATATIRNTIVSGSVEGYELAGGLVGYVYQGGDVDTELSDNTISGSIKTSSYASGGVAGDVYIDDGSFVVSDTTVSGPVETDGGSAGGFIGRLYSYGEFEIGNSSVSGDVVAGDEYAGGAIGYASGNSIQADSIALRRITTNGDVTGRYHVGGLVGYVSGYNEQDGSLPAVLIFQSRSAGMITATSGYNAGGLVGAANKLLIDESYATGVVQVLDDQSGGGLVGHLSGSEIRNSYATGNVATQWGYVGGLVGSADNSRVVNSYSIGTVTAVESEVDEDAVGGLVGAFIEEDGNSLTSSYWDVTTSGMPYSQAGTGKLTPQMKIQTTFTDWDFADVWAVTPAVNNGYPCLRWTNVQCVSPADQDGVDEGVEQGAPNGGDANDDGTPDKDQSDVTSTISPVSGKYITLESTCASNYNVQVGGESSDAAADQDYSYPAGLIGFTLLCGTPGVTATVTQYYYGDYDLNGMVLRKKMSTGEYITLTDATLSKVTIGGQDAVKAVYTITDGSAHDDDGVADGNIVDPVGLAVLTVGAPNTGFSGSYNSTAILLSIGVGLGVASVLAVAVLVLRKKLQ